MNEKSNFNHSPPKPFEEKYKPRTITGGYIDGHDLVGYCHYDGHKGYLRACHLKDHECLGKGCHYLEKNELSHFFMNLNFNKEKKRLSKLLKKIYMTGLLPVSTYMMLDESLRSITKRSKLEEFYDEQVQIAVDVRTLLKLSQLGGDEDAKTTDNS